MANSTQGANKNEENKSAENKEPSSPIENCEEKLTNTENKITIVFHATGNTPILKSRKLMVKKERKMGDVITFLKKLLNLHPSDSLFLYVNQAFAPSPDQTIKNLYECYGVEGTLPIHYCKSQAWG